MTACSNARKSRFDFESTATRSAFASSYGAAGAVIIILMWVYHSAQIFLLGAEFSKIHASRSGTQAGVRALA